MSTFKYVLPSKEVEETNKNDIRRMYLIHCTILEMLGDRGYTCDVAKETSIDDFHKRYCDKNSRVNRQELCFIVYHQLDSSKEILVHFMREESIGIGFIKELITYLIQNDIHNVILIGGRLSHTAKKIIARAEPRYIVEAFSERELLLNVTHHQLVPRHVILSDEKRDLIFKRHYVTKDKIPRISRHDPIARYFGMRPGQMCEIFRSSEIAGEYSVYRLCF